MNKASSGSIGARSPGKARRGQHLSSKIIVVTGTPGTGKTSFSRELSRRMEAKLIGLTSLITGGKLVFGKDEKRDALIVDEGLLAARLSSVVKDTNRYAIVEGHHVSQIVPKKIRLAFVLRCNPRELAERLRRRRYSTPKIRENVAAEVLDVCLVEATDWFGKELVCEIDTTGRSIVQVVDEACSVLLGGKCRMLGRTDWLNQMKREGALSSLL